MRFIKNHITVFIIFAFGLGQVNYNSDIQPIFNSSCTSCHGGSGGLSLTSYNNVMNGGNSGVVIISGESANSYLWQRVNNGAMPPGSNPELSSTQVNLIGLWIDEGANETSLSIVSENTMYPNKLSIIRNFPNPFNPTTMITYGLTASTNVQIAVYDISGKQIQSLLNGFQTAGYHSLNWDASLYPSGMYFAKMIAGEHVHTQKLMLVK